MVSTELIAQSLLAGIIIGIVYALMALGITFIYSIVKMINWAMGEFYMIGSYVQYFLVVELLGPDLWFVAAPLARSIPLATLASILVTVAWNISEVDHFRTLLRAPKPDALQRFRKPIS